MRLIDADAFIKELEEKIFPELVKRYGEEEALKGLHFSYRDCICNINGQPTVELATLQPTCNQLATDCISRQAAIDGVKTLHDVAWKNWHEPTLSANVVLDMIRELPSAQPEIIRCKDCKHWDGVDTCDVIDAPVWDNDFCSLAERRSHE